MRKLVTLILFILIVTLNNWAQEAPEAIRGTCVGNRITYGSDIVTPGSKSQWNGYERYDFRFKERDAIVVVPKQAAKGNPWIWRPAFFDAFPSVDKALLEKGFHVVYYDVTHSYGNPRAVALGTDFYNYIYSLSNL